MHQLKDHPSAQQISPPILPPQVPPVRPEGATTLKFTYDALIVKVAALGPKAAVRERYAGDKEYWYATKFPLTKVPSLSMCYDEIVPVNDSSLDSFFNGLTRRFAAVTDPSNIDWQQGPYRSLPDNDPLFFTAPDPDGGGKLIGLMLVVDNNSALTHIVWFKMADPAIGYSGPIWQLKNAPKKEGLTFSAVALDPEGVPPPPPPQPDSVQFAWFHLAEGGTTAAPPLPKRSPTPAR